MVSSWCYKSARILRHSNFLETRGDMDSLKIVCALFPFPSRALKISGWRALQLLLHQEKLNTH